MEKSLTPKQLEALKKLANGATRKELGNPHTISSLIIRARKLFGFKTTAQMFYVLGRDKVI